MPEPPPPDACAIAVMAKASAPGRTKTRMVPPLTFEEAAALNTTFLKDIAENIARAAEAAPIAAYMAFAPSGSEAFFHEHLPPTVGLIEATRGHFGECLLETVQTLLRRGHKAACVLNSDSPTLPHSLLVELAEVLAAPGERGVIGPAEDGGYYVLGLKAAHGRLFEDIDWSTERVFEQTMARAEQTGLSMHVLRAWYDVDDAEGLRRLRRDIFAPDPSARDSLAPSPARHTRALLEQMDQAGALDQRLGVAG
jgi:rSAM/selenodomain-associated transferase 1